MESREGSDALFQYATEGILIVNNRGVITRLNPSAEKLFGYDVDELIGAEIEKLIPQRFTTIHKSNRSAFSKKPHARSMGAGLDLFALKKNGTEFPVEVSLSPYKSSEGNFVIAFIIDVSMRKEAEKKLTSYSKDLEKQVKNRTLILEEAINELEKTKNDLNESLRKEKELNELKSRFMSMASHEFRTPLATMQSSLSLVKKYGELNDNDKQEKHISKIKSSINNLTDILSDFLSVSKLEEGKVESAPEEIAINEFISDVIAEMKTLLKDGQKMYYKHTGMKTVSLDKKFLKNIFFNLLSNAIKFSPENKTISVSTTAKKTSVIIEVKDRGIGISKADQKHLFERFYRGNNATHIQGTGLGLNIVSKYVELMNGTVKFTSTENNGSTFTITLPQ